MAALIKIIFCFCIFTAIGSPFLFWNANEYIEDKAYVLKWQWMSLRSTKISGIIDLVFIIIMGGILLSFFEYIRNYSFVKRKVHAFTNLMKVGEFNRQKKVNTDLSLKRLENSREYQHYLKEKRNGKYPEIVLEEDEKIKFSDED